MTHCSIKVPGFLSQSLFVVFGGLLLAQSPAAKRGPESLDVQLQWLVETPAVSGHEADLAAVIRERIHGYTAAPIILGDVIVTVGSGAPHRVIAAPMDEPGYVVSDITRDGYLRVQRLPQNGILPLFEELYSGQPVRIQSSSGSGSTAWSPGFRFTCATRIHPVPTTSTTCTSTSAPPRPTKPATPAPICWPH